MSIPRLTALALLLTCLGGCHFSRGRVNVPDFYQRAEQVQVGTTRGDELEGIFGGPAFQILDLKGDRKAHIYVFGDSKTSTFNLFIFSVGETNLGVDSGIFIVDASGVVEEVVVGQNSRDLPWDFWAFGD